MPTKKLVNRTYPYKKLQNDVDSTNFGGSQGAQKGRPAQDVVKPKNY